jgi:hypothetical protein
MLLLLFPSPSPRPGMQPRVASWEAEMRHDVAVPLPLTLSWNVMWCHVSSRCIASLNTCFILGRS